MVAFEKEHVHFNYRVAGVAIHHGRVLLDRNSRNHYWVFPGGHPEMMEPMTAALVREMREEIGVEVKPVRLLWVLENFYHKKHDIHELSFYFLMDLDPASSLLKSDGPFSGTESGHVLVYQWFPIEQKTLLALPLFPSNLVQAVMNMSNIPQHIVFHDSSASDGSHSSSEIPNVSNQRLTIP